MGYFPIRYDSRVIIYKRKMLIRLATDWAFFDSFCRLIFLKSSPNYDFGDILKTTFLKIVLSHFGATFGGIWTSFYSKIWSHCLQAYFSSGQGIGRFEIVVLGEKSKINVKEARKGRPN